jgi:hypothetical protein
MKYLCLVYLDERELHAVPDSECKACGDALRRSGHHIAAEALQPVHTATTVRVRNGKTSVTDGPFTETNEVVGGYAQFELKSKQAAVESAVRFMELHKKHWPGWEGETEVRQMFGPEDFGPEGCAPKVEERSPAAAG